MSDAGVLIRLFLQEEINVLFLEREGKCESLDRKRNLHRIIIEAKKIDLADDGLDRPLEFAHTLLLARKVLYDMRDDLLVDANLLE